MRALSISGLHDLEPIAHAPFLRADLRLSPTDALPLSPARHAPAPCAVLHAIVGANESDEFRRQTQLLRDAWGAAAVPLCEEIAPYRHFDIVEALADPASRPHAVLTALLRATGGDASARQES
jgi:arylformamidase